MGKRRASTMPCVLKGPSLTILHPGRVRHFLSVLDPTTLFVPTSEIERCARVLEEWRSGGHGGGVRHAEAELRDCQRIVDAAVHPTLRTVIPAPFRMASFTPVNVSKVTEAPAIPSLLARTHAVVPNTPRSPSATEC